MELFEQIRREYEHGGGTIRGIAKKLGIHRRMVREAVLSGVPVGQRRFAPTTNYWDPGNPIIFIGVPRQSVSTVIVSQPRPVFRTRESARRSGKIFQLAGANHKVCLASPISPSIGSSFNSIAPISPMPRLHSGIAMRCFG